ncbi:hypothetical protein SAMN02910289_00583 [Lachnospiraceae bacterium RM5]|nr:hypothetical protein SAMN02910289_00583 [Lachnospiraceae bacterium RM5]
MINLNKKKYCFFSILLIIVLLFVNINFNVTIVRAEKKKNKKIYLKDNTDSFWVSNDNSIIELVDNSNGHNHYVMQKEDQLIWSVEVPYTANNITFNRLSPDKSIKWNSWSAGGKNDNNMYCIDGAEYGHWETIEEIYNDFFREGDTIYLDLSEFYDWNKDDSIKYINFNNNSKKNNNGNDIVLAESDAIKYNPVELKEVVKNKIYSYTFTNNDINIYNIRFWRGNDKILWNNSCLLSYEDYLAGNNCIKITEWNDGGILTNYEDDNQGGVLSVSTNEILINNTSNIIYLYVCYTCKDNVYNVNKEKISLYADGEFAGYFYDDGNLDKSGDDICGDGIYTIKYDIGSIENKIENKNFKACIDDGSFTNQVTVTAILPFDDIELEMMEFVNNSIEEELKKYATPMDLLITDSKNIQNGGYKEVYEIRKQNVENKLRELLSLGYILEYNYDNINKNYVCTYFNENKFLIQLDDFFYAESFEDEIIKNYYDFKLDDEFLGKSCIILNTFENTEYRTHYYEKLVDEWRNSGVDVEYDDYVTVDEIATKLNGKDLIGLSGHGMISNGEPLFCLIEEEISAENDEKYAMDIRMGRVIQVADSDGTGSYAINNDFFEHYYGSEGLLGSFIFSESCMCMGSTELGLNQDIANTLVDDCGAAVFVGFYNSVIADYSRKMMKVYFEEILNGENADEAFKTAKEKCGSDDYEYREPSFWEFLLDKDAFEKMGNTAFPMIVGNKECSVKKELINGDFERTFFDKPFFWKSEGDVRVLPKLGEIKANGNKMAFLSTGIGKKEGINIDEGEGSQLTQKVYNVQNNILEFNYDVFSEEPMEYVDSEYDDKFEIQILDLDENIIYSDVLETVNTSDWIGISGIDFTGGDDTMYHTGWKNIKIDISEFKNRMIKVRFLVYDVGDSEYDTAAVIDDVKLLNATLEE